MGTRDVNFYLELAGRYGFGPEATRVKSLYMHERLAHFRGARSLTGQIEPQSRC
jgi:hypothetical protein